MMIKFKKIENLEQYAQVEKMITDLLKFVNDTTPVTDTNYLQLEVCTKLISEYDKIHYKVGKPSLTELLKLRMYERRLTQRDLSKILEVSPSRISQYINGKSEPTLEIAKRMHKFLNIQPAVFFR